MSSLTGIHTRIIYSAVFLKDCLITDNTSYLVTRCYSFFFFFLIKYNPPPRPSFSTSALAGSLQNNSHKRIIPDLCPSRPMPYLYSARVLGIQSLCRRHRPTSPLHYIIRYIRARHSCCNNKFMRSLICVRQLIIPIGR